MADVTVREYRAAVDAIERHANYALATARRSVKVAFPRHRSVRYRHMGDAIVDAAVANIRARIDAQMRHELNALEERFYAEQEDDGCGS